MLSVDQKPGRPLWYWTLVLLCPILIGNAAPAAELNAGAVVIVNSRAVDYANFQHFLEPYLIQFGAPYEVRDIAKQRLGADLGKYALIIVGHRGLDVAHTFLTPADEQELAAAVETGTGLVSFDGLLAAWDETRAHAFYQFMQNIFGLSFQAPELTTTVTIGASAAWPSPNNSRLLETRKASYGTNTLSRRCLNDQRRLSLG